MSFLTPLAFTLAIAFPIIIAMYLLKLRRTEQVVSSTYLWQRMVRDVEANAPWQRLRRNLLLLLQLLFLIAVIFALARPFIWVEGSSGAATILIVDISASMAATDVTPNRLEAAKDQARLIISNLPEETRTTLIAAGEGARVLVSSSTDRRQILQALESLRVQPVSSDLTSALELASAIAARQPDSEIVVLSDGRVTLPERLAIQGRIRYLPIGESGYNQALTLLTLESSPQREMLTAFVQIANYADEVVQRRLTLSADGRLLDAHDLEIPARGQISVISEIIPSETEVLEAALTEGDDLILDDRAWAVQRVSGNRSITLVSSGNRFLETALGLLPGVETTVVGLEDWKDGSLETNQPTQLTIFDSFTLTSTLPTGNILFIGPLASTDIFSVTGGIEAPIPRPAKDDDSLLAHVDLSQVSILDSARIPLPDWARPVIVDEATGFPLLFAGEIPGQRIAVFAFDPRRSDLPLQPAYPILIANLTNWLLPAQIGDIPAQIDPGDVLTFTPPPEVESLTIIRPDGTSTQLDIREGRAIFGDTGQVGVFLVDWKVGRLGFAVNLSNPQESDIQPVESLPLFENMATSDNGQLQQARHEFWRPLA
ncbi:MAG: BatA and WFA domain-containing protein, partial [Chloroflexota bacterium]